MGFILARTGDDGGGRAGAGPAPTVSSGNPGTAGPTPTTRASYPPAGLQKCPAQLRDRVGVDLTLVRAIQTGRSEAWICKGGNGKLFYQGHERGEPFPAATSDHSIHLTDVALDGDVYVATNSGNDGVTKYHVGRDRLRITLNGTERSSEPVTDRAGS